MIPLPPREEKKDNGPAHSKPLAFCCSKTKETLAIPLVGALSHGKLTIRTVGDRRREQAPCRAAPFPLELFCKAQDNKAEARPEQVAVAGAEAFKTTRGTTSPIPKKCLGR